MIRSAPEAGAPLAPLSDLRGAASLRLPLALRANSALSQAAGRLAGSSSADWRRLRPIAPRARPKSRFPNQLAADSSSHSARSPVASRQSALRPEQDVRPAGAPRARNKAETIATRAATAARAAKAEAASAKVSQAPPPPPPLLGRL